MARNEHVRHLAMAPNYWGIGNTEDEAVEQMLGAGGSIDAGYSLLTFPDSVIFQSVNPVYGTVEFAYENDERPEVVSTQVERTDGMRKRLNHIRRSLIADDIDADEREYLKDERDELAEMLDR